MNEEWKQIPGWESYYEASNCGRIRSVDRMVNSRDGRKRITRGQIMKGKLDKDGYLTVNLKRGQKALHTSVHRLVALAFIPNPNAFPQVNHLNFDTTDNVPSNLEWCSASMNANHSNIHGRYHFRKSKLNFDIADEIRRRRAAGERQVDLAIEYGVNKTTISMIYRNRSWIRPSHIMQTDYPSDTTCSHPS